MLIRKDKWFILGSALLLVAVLVFGWLVAHAVSGVSATIAPTENLQYALLPIFGGVVFCAIRSKSFFRLYVVLLFLAVAAYSLVDMTYSVIDEAAHFGYVNHIIGHHSLPVFSDAMDCADLRKGARAFNCVPENFFTVNHECVQAPLSYISLAILGSAFDDPFVRLHVLRLLSLLFIPAVWWFLNRAKRLLEMEFGFQVDACWYRLLLLFTVFSPDYLYRASRLSNETLTCVFVSVLVWLFVRNMIKGCRSRDFAVLSVVCAAIVLTKNTQLPVYVLPLILAVCHRRLCVMLCSCAVAFLLLVGPWLAFNVAHYGALTGLSQHVAFVLPIVNPSHEMVNLPWELLVRLTGGSFGEIIPTASQAFVVSAVVLYAGYLVVQSLPVGICRIVGVVLGRRSLAANRPKILKASFAILVVGTIAFIVSGCLATRIPAMCTRYLYPLFPAIVLFFCLSRRRCRSFAQGALSLVLALVVMQFVFGYCQRILSNEHLSVTENRQCGVWRRQAEVVVNESGCPSENLLGKEIVQSISLDKDLEVLGFSVQFGTFCVDEYEAQIESRIELLDGEGAHTVIEQSEKRMLRDCAFCPIQFKSPVLLRRGDSVRVYLRVHNDKGMPITLFKSNEEGGNAGRGGGFAFRWVVRARPLGCVDRWYDRVREFLAGDRLIPKRMKF